jgi:AcrR family transcriptional regulator
MKGSETRERIYRAAMQLAARDGLLTLTLENVAEESGLSKGGVMHHFRSKEELLSGVIAHFTDQVEREMTRLVAEDPNPTYRWVRAMLRIMTSTDHDSGSDLPTRQTLEQFMLSVLAATIHNPEVVKPVQAIGQRLRGRLTSVPEEGIEQLMMWLVLDGLFLWQFVGLLSSEDPLIEQVHTHLIEKLELLSGTSTASPRALRPSAKILSAKVSSANVSSGKSKKTKVPNSSKRSAQAPKESPNRTKKGG